MKVTVAHMGRLAQVVKPLLEDLGMDVVVAPPPGKATLSAGVRLSPEFACLPLKLNIGTFLDAAQAGADTIIMAGGLGPCRFGYYAEVQREILDKVGSNLKMIVLEPPRGKMRELAATIRENFPGVTVPKALRALWRAIHRINILDRLEAYSLEVGAAELEQGKAEEIFKSAETMIVNTLDPDTVEQIAIKAYRELKAIPGDTSLVRARIMLLGEIYCLLEPFVNMDVARKLTRLRVHVIPTVTLSDWIKQNLTLNPIRRKLYRKKLFSYSRGYLDHWVGGEGLETIANTVRAASEDVDGVVQIAPFTCMPEIVGQCILPRVSHDFDMPYLSLFFDEHSSETGLETRLEAFADMLEARRRRKGRDRVSVLSCI